MKNIKPINVKIGKNLREQRERANFTQEKLAASLGRSPNHVSDLERGHSGLTIDMLYTLCRLFGISSDKILFGEDHLNSINSEIIEKLQRIDPQKLKPLETIINAYLEAVEGLR